MNIDRNKKSEERLGGDNTKSLKSKIPTAESINILAGNPIIFKTKAVNKNVVVIILTGFVLNSNKVACGLQGHCNR